MASDKPPWASKGMRLTAALWNSLVRFILSNRVNFTGPGFCTLKTKNGVDVSLSLVPEIRYAVVTTELPARTDPSGVRTLGKGAGTIYSLAYSTSMVATLVTTGLTAVPIYNPGGAAIASGKLVQVHMIQGQWHVISEICS